MNADICDQDDTAAIDALLAALRRLGATQVAHDWAPDIDRYLFGIGDAELTIWIDQWVVIEGPDDLVHQVLIEYGQPARATW